MNYIHAHRDGETVVLIIEDVVAQKLMALLASATDVTGEPWDLVRLMNYLSNQGVTHGVYYGDGNLSVRVHPMFKEKL